LYSLRTDYLIRQSAEGLKGYGIRKRAMLSIRTCEEERTEKCHPCKGLHRLLEWLKNPNAFDERYLSERIGSKHLYPTANESLASRSTERRKSVQIALNKTEALRTIPLKNGRQGSN
jgi:hypothetical protein